MFQLVKTLNQSWLTQPYQIALWHYKYVLLQKLGAQPKTRRAEMVAPGISKRFVLNFCDLGDAINASTVFSNSNPWSQLKIEAATILDLGSNNGFTSLYWQLRFPSATVFGLDMDESNVRTCEGLFNQNGLTPRFTHCAICDKDGPVTFRRHSSVTRHSLSSIAESHKSTQFTSIDCLVEGYSLSTFLNKNSLNTVDFVKVDIEGAEELLLKDIQSWARRVKSLVIEIHENVDAVWARSTLEDAGYHVSNVPGTSRPEFFCKREL